MAPLPRNDVLLVTVDERSRLLESQEQNNSLQEFEEEAQHRKKSMPLDNNDGSRLVLIGGPDNSSHRDDSDRSLLSRGWIEYNNKLDCWPLSVKGVTAFFLLGLADACAQGCQRQLGTANSNHWDAMRSLRFGIFGLLGAPWSHYYFDLLDFMLPPTPENPCSWVTFLKLFIDQFLQAPLLLALIIVVLHAMEGQGFTSTVQDLQDHYWTTLIANWKLWLPASFVNLAFVKPSLRVLFENVVFFVWTIILSVILNS